MTVSDLDETWHISSIWGDLIQHKFKLYSLYGFRVSANWNTVEPRLSEPRSSEPSIIRTIDSAKFNDIHTCWNFFPLLSSLETRPIGFEASCWVAEAAKRSNSIACYLVLSTAVALCPRLVHLYKSSGHRLLILHVEALELLMGVAHFGIRIFQPSGWGGDSRCSDNRGSTVYRNLYTG